MSTGSWELPDGSPCTVPSIHALQQLYLWRRGGCAVLRVQPRRGDAGHVDAAAQGELRLPALRRPDAPRHQGRVILSSSFLL